MREGVHVQRPALAAVIQPGVATSDPASPAPPRRRGTLFWLGPPLAYMALIFCLGTDQGGAPNTFTLLERLLQLIPALSARLSPQAVDLLNTVLRKIGHFLGYALLALLDARAYRGVSGELGRRGGATAWGAAVTWAAVDEFHQSFFPTRGGSPWDVLLDAAGAAFGVFCYWLLLEHAHHPWKPSLSPNA